MNHVSRFLGSDSRRACLFLAAKQNGVVRPVVDLMFGIFYVVLDRLRSCAMPFRATFAVFYAVRLDFEPMTLQTRSTRLQSKLLPHGLA